MATSGSASRLGWSDLRDLDAGAEAVITCYDTSGPPDAGVADHFVGVAEAPPRRPAHRVVVAGGRTVVDDGQLVATGGPTGTHHLRRRLDHRSTASTVSAR